MCGDRHMQEIDAFDASWRKWLAWAKLGETAWWAHSNRAGLPRSNFTISKPAPAILAGVGASDRHSLLRSPGHADDGRGLPLHILSRSGVATHSTLIAF
jgi:hypothetical protein